MVSFAETKITFVSEIGSVFSFKVNNSNNYDSNVIVTVKPIDRKRPFSLDFITSHSTDPFVPSKALDRVTDEELEAYGTLMENIQNTCFLSIPANTTITLSVLIKSSDIIRNPLKINVSIREV